MLGEFAKYGFCGLKRKRRDFERSVLKYVSIKISALTHSGRKRRVCVNAPDRLGQNCEHGGARDFSQGDAVEQGRRRSDPPPEKYAIEKLVFLT